jgi:hypothetical protein
MGKNACVRQAQPRIALCDPGHIPPFMDRLGRKTCSMSG